MTPRHLVSAYPGDIETRTGGYGYNRRVMACLAELGWSVTPLALGEGFPQPDQGQLQQAEILLSQLPDGANIVIDGLAFGVLDDWAGREAARLRVTALVHHPLALETGLEAAQREAFARSETEALRHVESIVVTSHRTAVELRTNYGVPESRIAVAIPGIDPPSFKVRREGPPVILSVGSLIRRKGHDILISALEHVRDLEWTCRIVGSTDMDRQVTAELEQQIEASGLSSRITLVGRLDDAREEFARADIFALASRYEGYGMVFAEALVQGLPIVGCAAGAIPEVVPEQAGLLVPPDDAPAFAAALRRLLTEPETRLAMENAAALEGGRLPSWRDTARIISDFLERGPASPA